jgi:hypothetical protein
MLSIPINMRFNAVFTGSLTVSVNPAQLAAS